ncbi:MULTISPECIES: hypothetical protein [Corallococcus]|uniref:hypothetical protein n=1 Tax=Corallococcus TaxID=83461 RepID=UPI0011810185|nr:MULTISPECIES: hypothetical protein [Corallococcus]NBD12234.1 hypothetical protein [Corallococcus silvisoli]TSC25188.1 hypothetical protein FOF48_24970 [Corallococcus sp. Z5C101001]
MSRPTPRTLLLLAFALCVSSCDYIPTAWGECTGTHLGRRVKWPIEERSSVVHLGFDQGGPPDTFIALHYTPEDTPALEGFGVDIHLVEGARVREDRTVKLSSRQGQLVPEESSLVLRWVGNIGGAAGYLSSPGVPVEGSVLLEEVTESSAEGRFHYRYADGGELTCTFEVWPVSTSE